jgi:parallel beta-helix repeat protein
MKHLSCLVLLGLTLHFVTGCQPPASKAPAPPAAPPPQPSDASAQSGPILAPPEHGDATPVIAAALQKFGTIRLMDGATFRLGSSVRLASGQGLVGNAILVPDFDHPVESGMANAAVLIEGNDVRVEGLTIRKPFKDGSYGIGVAVSGRKNITLRNLEITGYSARYGILAVESSELEISGCTVRDFMMNASSDMISDSPAGVCLKRCTNAIVSNNRVFRIEAGPQGRESISPLSPKYGRQGYQPDHFYIGQCVAVSMVGNVMETSGEGIDVLLSSNCTISGNVIRDIWFQGVKMLGVSSTTVDGNFISDCYQGVGLATHSRFNAECENNVITDNVILNTGSPGSFGVPGPGRVKFGTTAGVDLHDTSKNNIVANNLIRNTSAEAVLEVPISGNLAANLVEGNLVPGTLDSGVGSQPQPSAGQ